MDRKPEHLLDLDELRHLTPAAKRLVNSAFQLIVSGEDVDYGLRMLQQAVSWDPIYDREPAGLEEFLLSREYLGLMDGAGIPYVHKRIVQLMVLAEDPTVRQVHLCLGKNSGKSFFSSCMVARMIYNLACMQPSPQDFLPNLAPGSMIHMLNLATNKAQAQRSVFQEIKIKIAGGSGLPGSPWFRRYGFKEYTTKFYFPRHNIDVICGHSRAEGWLGANTILGIIDEASYFQETLEELDLTGYPVSAAERNFNALFGSCRTRFPDHYKIILISSPKHQKDYLFEKVREVEANGHRIDIDNVEVRGRYPEKLVVSPAAVDDANLSQYDIGLRVWRDTYRVAAQAPTWELRSNETILNYERDFAERPTQTARDFGAQPYYAESPYFNWKNLEWCFMSHNRQNPLEFIPRSPSSPDVDMPEGALAQKRRMDVNFVGNPDRVYFVHIDFATGGDMGGGDACGFAMGHVENVMLANRETERMIVFDIVTRFQFADNTPVDAEEVADFVYWLQCGRREFRPQRRLEKWEGRDGRHFKRLHVSIDGFNKEIFQGLLRKRGLSVVYFSSLKSVEYWQETEYMFYQHRVLIPRHPILEEEIKGMQHTSKGVPDHCRGGSKDIMDCVVAVIHRALQSSGSVATNRPYRSRRG